MNIEVKNFFLLLFLFNLFFLISECFENHFELIEDYLEIRLESIRIKIDQHQLKSMRALDKFQNRLVGHKQRKKVSQKFQLYFNFKKKFLIQHLQIAKEEVAFIS